ncbi:hypothetical protein SAMN04490185_1888 [Pseudomonas frederiksbergensis]|uniref:Uncharacterized protein n=1 Tax=Pseudomonas frederiksbergensis TaxID=104087 RepID=A0A1H4UJ64_9PSED|nr:DUF6002 family protein [Pseudomonas frederiksbergensis]SEC68184.1 hypothetical protein SAMN04490185_1888 [Pseudomonas frederiksbergensis]
MDVMKSGTGALVTRRPQEPIPVIERYYDLIVASAPGFEVSSSDDAFEPSMRLPELDPRMQAFLSVATAQFFEMGRYRDVPLRLLDLRQNANTQTTKTFASTLIVARAIRHIQETGESILLFSPSSGNKAIALRDAVLRALKTKLAHPEQLRIVTLTPAQTTGKLRRTELYDDPRLRALNPVFVLDTESPEAVKVVGQQFKALFNRRPLGDSKLWHFLRLENYRFSDQVRAFFDCEYGDAWDTDRRTVHVHAVSSAYGLLGYCSGVEVLKRQRTPISMPSFLLVQHLATSDMVLHLLDGNFEGASAPSYTQAPNGLWVQTVSAHFPAATWSPDEVLEPTFYTHLPPTAEEMTGHVRANGGSGIIVSLYECMQRYSECVQLLADTPVSLPADPRDLKEWSLVMTMTGCMNAIDRQLLEGMDGCTIHASGSYCREDYEAIPAEGLSFISSAEEMMEILSRCSKS